MGRPTLPDMPPSDDAATRIIPFYSLRLGDLVVPRAILVMQCKACRRVSRVAVVPVLAKFGHRYGVRDLERVHVCAGCAMRAHGSVTVEWL